MTPTRLPRRLLIRSGILLVSGGIAGALSSIMMITNADQPIFLLRGAFFGGVLATMILAVEWWQIGSRRPIERRPAWGSLLLCAVIACLVSGWILNLPVLAVESTQYITAPEGGRTFVVTGAYTLLFALVWRFRSGPKRTIHLFIVAGTLAATSRFIGIDNDLPHELRNMFRYMLPCLVFFGGPFGLLWGLALVLFDPGFTEDRWRRLLNSREG